MAVEYADAASLVEAYRRGAISPVEALRHYLVRIERLNPRLNAIVTLDEGGAARAARASEARWRAGAPLGPLDGVPVTVKDNLLVAGLRASWGSHVYEDFIPDHDELPVARLRAAGAVIVGKTNAPEFTLQGFTDNPIFGATRNPWDLDLTPGGSSGGAVAAVAAGLAPVAIGTDGGGSIRRPASHTGLVGLKPTAGRIPRADGFPVILHDFEVVAPVGRTLADVAALMAVLSGPDARDPSSLAYAPVSMLAAASPRRIRFIPRFATAPVDPEVARSVARAATALGELGHSVDEGTVPFDLPTFDRAWSVVSQSGLAWLLRGHSAGRDKIGTALATMAEAGRGFSAADYVEALAIVRDLRRRLSEAFAETDLLLTPTAAALPWPIGESHPAVIDNRPVGPRGHAVFTGFVNATGCPAINVPGPPSDTGLPIGFQLVGPWGADEWLLAVAAQYERACPWRDRWPACALSQAA
jgi:aspartyl-tRNA(Asn)/glutamyl-tRNA(Gln) amidotransferase subunit A